MSVQLSGGFEGTVTLSPGMTTVASPQTVSGSGAIGNKQVSGTPCVSQTGITYTGATVTWGGSANLGCATGAAGSQSPTLQVQWFIGNIRSDTSTIDMAVQTNGQAVTALTATVHGGQLDGATVTALLTTLTNVSGNCGTTPVTSVSFAGTTEFIK